MTKSIITEHKHISKNSTINIGARNSIFLFAHRMHRSFLALNNPTTNYKSTTRFNPVFVLLFLLSFGCFAQNSSSPFAFWRLTSASGEIKGRYELREQDLWYNGLYDVQKSSYITGGFLLNTTSFFVHPKFVILYMDGEYNPQSIKDNYLIFPDQSGVLTTKRLNVRANFLNEKPYNFGVFTNFNESYYKRDNLTDVESSGQQMGGNFSWANKILPFSAYFSKSKMHQKELDTTFGRELIIEDLIGQGKLNKSFTKFDKNELIYTHHEISNVTEMLFPTKNIVDEINLNDEVYFDKLKRYRFNSIINNYNQWGSLKFSRFQASENLRLQLSKNLTSDHRYTYFDSKILNNRLQKHSFNSVINHQLYKSLNSGLFFEYNHINHTAYIENFYKLGFELKYMKEIPKGKLFLTYKYYRYHQANKSESVVLNIINEECLLVDNQIVLLKRPYVDLSSIVIKDATNTIIYLNNIDYQLIQIGNFVQVQRIPTGMISDNSTVYIDYKSIQPGNYKYDANNHLFGASVLLFKNKLEVYYRMSTQDYSNLDSTNFLILNYFTQHVIGTKVDFDFVNFGTEYENYKSTLIPFTMLKVFINLQKDFKNKVLISLTANRQDYKLINEGTKQTYTDIIGRGSYNIYKMTRFNLSAMYRNQKGSTGLDGFDLDLFSGKAEISTVFRQLYLSLGAEIYRRNYVGETIQLRGAYFQISRKF